MLNWPPISAFSSNSSTWCPRLAATVAASSPAGPAPTTAIFFLLLVGSWIKIVSWQARGFTIQEETCMVKVWSRQAWLHAIQVLISSGRPSMDFSTNSGSAKKGRAMETMSALPSAKTCSATSGMLMRLVVTKGMLTSPIIFLVTQAKPALGTMVPMVGTRDSCQPIPVLIMVAPAASMALASCTTSSQVLPPSTRSSIERR